MAKKQGETALRKAVDDLLSLHGWGVMRIYTGPIIVGKGDKAPNPMAGFADVIAIKRRVLCRINDEDICAGNVIFIETKSSKGVQTPAQKAFQAWCEEYGAPYFLVRSYEDAEEQFKKAGVI